MGLGWDVSVYRQADGGRQPATGQPAQSSRLGSWSTDPFGLRWLDTLVKDGQATCLDSTGYPSLYTARTAHVLPAVRDVATLDEAVVAACGADEWLVVVAWDQS